MYSKGSLSRGKPEFRRFPRPGFDWNSPGPPGRETIPITITRACVRTSAVHFLYTVRNPAKTTHVRETSGIGIGIGI